MITKTPRRHRCDGQLPRDPRNAVPGAGTGTLRRALPCGPTPHRAGSM